MTDGSKAAGGTAGKTDRYYAKVVGKALAALDEIRAAPAPLALNEITRRLGLAKTSVFRILHTLEVAGYIERDPAGRYQVTASLGPASGRRERLLSAAAGPMKALHREFSETVSLAMLFDHHIEVVATIESPQLVRMGNIVGRILPPHASSLGKAVTAFQDDTRRESLLRSYGVHRFTAHTLVDERELKDEFDRIRRDGYSLDAEESALEGCCFGAPIRDASGAVYGALSLSMPKSRMKPAALRPRVIAAVRRAADRISSAK